MSLTSLLKSPSPLRKFFADHFPNTRELVSSLNGELATNAPSISDSLSSADVSVIGTAFDYRARLYFQPLDLERVTARRGVRMVQIHLSQKTRGTLAHDVFAHVGQILQQHAAPARLLLADDEDHVNGCCLLLAYFEQFFRALFPPDSSPLFRALVASKKPDEVWRRVCTPVLLQDLRQLSSRFYKRWENAFAKPVTLNPTFAGSTLVGGADADIIVDGTLIEFKTSRQARPVDRDHLWQLLGYVLLDFEDVYNIHAIGFDFVRHNVTRSWRVDELTGALAGSHRPIAEWRRQTERVCKTLKPYLYGQAEEQALKFLIGPLLKAEPPKRRRSRRAPKPR